MLHHIPHSSLTRHHHGWLDSRFHFAFAGDMAPMGFKFGPLRVWNDDWIAPSSGFDMHPHRDMEIITYVRKGAITHRDSVGNQGRTAAGNVQVMSAGTGIFHSEHNEEDVPTELFQIWVEPDKAGLPPRWEEAAALGGGRLSHLRAERPPRPPRLRPEGGFRRPENPSGRHLLWRLPQERRCHHP